MSWSYQREERPAFEVIPEGAHRVRIAEATKSVSQKGNDMLSLKLEVSGHNGYLFDHIVFLQDRPEVTNGKLTAVFDSFKDIKEGDFNLAGWVGKVGAAQVKHEEYRGETQARVHYYIAADKQSDLPPWQEPKRESKQDDGFSSAMAGDIPF